MKCAMTEIYPLYTWKHQARSLRIVLPGAVETVDFNFHLYESATSKVSESSSKTFNYNFRTDKGHAVSGIFILHITSKTF